MSETKVGDERKEKKSRYNTPEKRVNRNEYMKIWRLNHKESVRVSQKKARQKRKDDKEKRIADVLRHRANRSRESARIRRYKETQRVYQKTINAMNGGSKWAAWEIEMAFNARMTDFEICKILGRSQRAIGLARIRYAASAPLGWTPKGTKPVEVLATSEHKEESC